MSQPAYITPGEIISIFGLSIGPDRPTSYQLDSAGRVSSNLNGLEVLFDGIPAPILYASKDQINVVVPFSLTLNTAFILKAIDLTVQNPAAATLVFPQIVYALPGIFESDGRGLILNQDATLNSPTNPAQPGSTISLFVTGLGPLTPTPTDGAIAAAPASKPELTVVVCLGPGPLGPFTLLDPALVTYAGDAPGQIEGVQQINLTLPTGAVFNTLYVQAGPGISNAVAFSETY